MPAKIRCAFYWPVGLLFEGELEEDKVSRKSKHATETRQAQLAQLLAKCQQEVDRLTKALGNILPMLDPKVRPVKELSSKQAEVVLGISENTFNARQRERAAGNPLAAPPYTVREKKRRVFADITLLRHKMLQDGMRWYSDEAMALFKFHAELMAVEWKKLWKDGDPK